MAQFHETGIIGYTGLVGQYVSASGEAGCDITPGDNSVQVNITWTVGRNGAFIPGSQGVPGIDAEVCGWNYEDVGPEPGSPPASKPGRFRLRI